MRNIIICLSLLICTSSYSQKQLSRQATNELVNKASSFLGFQNNEKVRVALNKYITTYNSGGGYTAMANLRNDLKGRDDLLNILNRATGNRESLLMTLTAMNVNSRNVPEIVDYFFPPRVPKEATDKRVTLKDSPVRKGPLIQEVRTPIVWLPVSKKFFDGRRTFCDTARKWYYTVTIIRNNIILIKYPGQPSIKSAALLTEKALINGDHIVSAENLPANYKYEDNIFLKRQ